MPALAALTPALLLALFAFVCGSFPGAAAAPAGPLGQLALVATALAGARAWRDPLGLGAAGRWLLAAALVAAAASWAVSPVPRAGRTALVLLPSFLALVPALAAAIARRRDLAIAGWGVATAAVAIWGLARQALGHAERAAMPLGHHNLLAAFLVIVLPVAALGLRRAGPARWIAALAVTSGVAAIAATRSALGLAVLALAGLAAAAHAERARRLVAGLALLGLAALVPRAQAVLAGRDSSAGARTVYARAALAGIAERPLLGWGPGSTPWMLAERLEPRPGVNPAGEAVGEAHSLPLALAAEIGLPGTLLAAAALGLFGARRLRAAPAGGDRELALAGLCGLGAGVGMSAGNAFLAVPALPLALAAAAAAALAGGGEPAVPPGRGRGAWIPALLLGGASAVVLLPAALAQEAYQRATRAPTRAEARVAVARAAALDPGFPLYAARAAWLPGPPIAERAAAAVAAAESAHGVAALWLRAGTLALEAADYDAAQRCFARARDLDPLSGVAPFLIYVASGGRDLDCAARALAAEPRLAAAVHWRKAPGARRTAIERLAEWPGLPSGFAAQLAERAAAPVPESGEEVDLAVQLDATPSLAVSLHQFRRSPWPDDVARIRLARAAVRAVAGVGSAAGRADTAPGAFPRGRCAPGSG